MTLTITLAPEVERALLETAQQQGQTPEETAAAALHSVLLSEERPTFSDTAFLAGAEAIRHLWDTPEEDAAWAHLQ